MVSDFCIGNCLSWSPLIQSSDTMGRLFAKEDVQLISVEWDEVGIVPTVRLYESSGGRYNSPSPRSKYPALEKIVSPQTKLKMFMSNDSGKEGIGNHKNHVVHEASAAGQL